MTRHPLTVGIDATNLRGGGSLTHLIELLRAAEPEKLGVERVVVWGGSRTLDALENRPWLGKRSPPALDKGLMLRSMWQCSRLALAARDEGCDVLFVPGGTYAGSFRPAVTMSQNLLPFEMPELSRYGWSLRALKFLMLRLTQSHSFKRSDGVIFLTEYARNAVSSVTGKLNGRTCIVPHGFNPRFDSPPRLQRSIAEYNDGNPYRLLYVSIVDQYKHQWHLVEAVAALRREGLPIKLDLVGPAYPPALKRLEETIARTDGDQRWVRYLGPVPYNELHHHYARADLGVFASSCENMPNILLETMASGLPIACSNIGPMPEVLGNAGVYFEPEQPETIARALRQLIASPELRTKLAQESYERAQQFSWQRCAEETFGFLAAVMRRQE